MKRKRFSTEQIVAAMKQHELGTPAAEIIRKLGIAEQTFYRRSRRHAPPHLWRHPDGFGGVLALGCTVGQGITGMSTLADMKLLPAPRGSG